MVGMLFFFLTIMTLTPQSLVAATNIHVDSIKSKRTVFLDGKILVITEQDRPKPGKEAEGKTWIHRSVWSLAIASMVLGIVGVLTSIIPIAGLIPGTLAIIFAETFLRRLPRWSKKKRGKGAAITGLITGIVVAVIAIAATWDWIWWLFL